MTQALVNNLNIFQEKTVNLTEKMSKNQGMDFGKIFESKTSDNNSININKESSEKVTNPITNDRQNSDDTITKNTNITDDIAIKNNTSSINNTANDSDIVSENTDTDGVVSDSNTINYPDNKNIQTDAAIEIEEAVTEIIEELIPTEDTTITNEDPTMYNELSTLEDSASLLLLQTQIQKTVLNTANDEQEVEQKDNSLFKSTSQNLQDKNSNTAIFKQFDNNVEKDVTSQAVQNSIIKETKYSKNEHSKSSNTINENIVKELNVEVASSQTANSESTAGNLMQNQSPQEQAARVMIQGDVKFEEISQEAIKNSTPQKTTEITPSKIIEQISKQLDNMVNNSKLNIVLNPEKLGKINLQIFNSKDGLTAQFTVTTQETKDILMKGLDGLKENLLAQGVSVDNVSVKIEETENEYNPDYTEQEGSNGSNKQQQAKKQKENNRQFEQMMFELENEVNV